ncbi:MAG: Protein translocase subunit SecF [Candidatus Uhrbacteria bacterium GW2011_GWE2_45_35]|uniref:Protein-export membrane protein SecF n=2 Tax=Candidatus Uhriibacteriota TaxID=1752732 RepID=A0A0G1JH64_9BACT|nr:MAG: Protein translocase subunit SecF [Candidatus Uhrbacteria bacterium GW2011_GWF2_44_350]KKU08627.1 MAG: Protein translocase subunit SecF [Candidatus Uhrbacteria bacterium GW2011_GWE2_45_35]HBR80912.1 protein translocase subunit SecF [Candidatus Uhrbacteria bacterium]HCU31228.1 protein translocase subunit SecF [Candidatus Uhrbacteria bacterium]
MKFSIVKHRRVWYSISTLLVGLSIAAITVFGFNFGIDFTGGSLMEVGSEAGLSLDNIRSSLSDIGYTHAVVQPSGDSNFLIRLESLDEEAHQTVLSVLRQNDENLQELRFDSFGPSIGSELRRKTITGVIIVLILIAAYVAFVFRKVSEPVVSWKYGVLTILAGFHDVIVPLGLFSVLGYFFGWQIDTAFVAAALTILGYSINDTIVVFDRTRENLSRYSGGDTFEEVVDSSIRQTIARSLYTTLTTMLALVAIFFFGGDSTRPFALALLVGIGTGAYSSIFIASPLLVTWEKFRRGK